ncbi:hypothetical protein B0A54_12914 [Friedmanniomyces endolithicus]|uniref:Uncharacterized protein n=1 Tax=Friedmanniomyces endolithicus TaxID=329885 RepID=A0A4U0ULW0_9PEZI|nr:hypothetical protein B0A54_12914 [Friedmanniomyces endolithicus]
MVGSQKRATKRPAEGIDDIDHGGNRGVLHNHRLACYANVVIRLLAAALDGKDLAPLPGALKTFETFDLSSFSLQLVDGGATTQSLQMAPTKANINAKIERDVGDDAERAIASRPDEIRKYALLDDAEICLRAVWLSSPYKVPCWRQNRYNTHRIKRDQSLQTDLTANAWELRVAYVPGCRHSTDFKRVELAAFYATSSRPAAKREC